MGAPGIWIRGDDEIEAGDINDAPVGYSRLDAYRLGWVSIAYEPVPVVEGTEEAMRRNSPRLAGVIQDRYEIEPLSQDPGFGELLDFTVILRTYDSRGRPTGWRYSTLEEVMLGITPRMAARRPNVRAYRRWYYGGGRRRRL